MFLSSINHNYGKQNKWIKFSKGFLLLYKSSINPLNPNIKIQILICYPYTFSIEVVGRICWSIN